MGKQRKQFGVLGLGIFGSSIVKTLSDYDVDVIAVDSNIKCVDRLKNYATQSNVVDITDKNALEQIGIQDCDVVVVAVGSNLEAAILAVLHCKDLGVKQVIAKSKNKRNAEILTKIGADKVIRPEKDMGYRVAKRLLTNNITDIIEINEGKNCIVELKAPQEWVNRNLIEIAPRANYNMNIIGIKNGEQLHTSFTANYVVKAEDILLVIGETRSIEAFDYIVKHK